MHLNLTSAEWSPATALHPIEPLLDIAQVSRLTSLSKTTIPRLVRTRQFPEPVVLAWKRSGRPSRVAWKAGDIRTWIMGRVGSRAA